MGHAARTSDAPDQIISRTTSDGRTELDATELLRSDQVRKTYEAFGKFRDLRKHSLELQEIEKLRNTFAHPRSFDQIEQVLSQFDQFQKMIEDMRKTLPSRERDQLKAFDQIEQVRSRVDQLQKMIEDVRKTLPSRERELLQETIDNLRGVIKPG